MGNKFKRGDRVRVVKIESSLINLKSLFPVGSEWIIESVRKVEDPDIENPSGYIYNFRDEENGGEMLDGCYEEELVLADSSSEEDVLQHVDTDLSVLEKLYNSNYNNYIPKEVVLKDIKKVRDLIKHLRDRCK